MAVAGSATPNVWFAAEAIVGATISLVLSLVAAVLPPAPDTTSCMFTGADTAVKVLNWSPETLSWSLAPKSEVTFKTRVLPAAS